MNAVRDARDQWISKYLDKNSEVIKLQTVETKLKEANKSLDGKNKMLT